MGLGQCPDRQYPDGEEVNLPHYGGIKLKLDRSRDGKSGRKQSKLKTRSKIDASSSNDAGQNIRHPR